MRAGVDIEQSVRYIGIELRNARDRIRIANTTGRFLSSMYVTSSIANLTIVRKGQNMAPSLSPLLHGYPATIAECLRPNRTYNANCLRAMKRFRRAFPWYGSTEQRKEKLRILNIDLANAYRIDPPALHFDAHYSRYSRIDNSIHLSDLSVVTYLHEFGHALGKGERSTCIWSINLFRRVFPRSYARYRHDGHFLRIKSAE